MRSLSSQVALAGAKAKGKAKWKGKEALPTEEGEEKRGLLFRDIKLRRRKVFTTCVS